MLRRLGFAGCQHRTVLHLSGGRAHHHCRGRGGGAHRPRGIFHRRGIELHPRAVSPVVLAPASAPSQAPPPRLVRAADAPRRPTPYSGDTAKAADGINGRNAAERGAGIRRPGSVGKVVIAVMDSTVGLASRDRSRAAPSRCLQCRLPRDQPFPGIVRPCRRRRTSRTRGRSSRRTLPPRLLSSRSHNIAHFAVW